MKSLSKLLRGLICIVIIFMFMFSGLLVSMLSALIECSVFIQIFKTDLIDSKIITLFSFGIAIGFEVVKNFANIIIPITTIISSPNESLIKFSKRVKKSRIFLVAISLICTLIFTSNCLIKTTSTIAEKDQAIKSLTTQFEKEQKEINKSIEKDYNSELKILHNNVDKSKKKLDDAAINFGIDSSIYIRLNNEYKKDQDLLKEFQKSGYKKIVNSKDYQDRLNNLQIQFNKDKKDIFENKNIILQQSTYLNNFINLIGLEDDNQQYYIVTVIIISLIISIIIEMVISIVSSFLSTNANPVFEELDMQIKLSAEEFNKINRIIKSIYNAILCLAIYLLIMQFGDQPIVTESIVIIFLTYLISNKIMMMNMKNEDINFFNKIKEVITNGLITFAAYFIFGMLFGCKYTDLSSIAVTLGAIIGQYLNLNLPIPFFSRKKP